MPRPAKPSCVLFDFDGVCADTEKYGLQLDREVYQQFGIEPTQEQLHSLVGTTGLESIPALFREYGMDVSAQEFFARRRDNVSIYRDFPLEVQPGLLPLLADLRSRRIPTGLVSTTAAQSILYALNRLGLMACFDVVVCGDMVQHHKPDPEPYQRAIEALGVGAAEGIAVDDSPTGISSAKGAGLYVLGYAGASIVQDTSQADETIRTFEGLQL
ncbi:MAG: HAD family hydrolase [Atopobiaceae bacterium]